MSSLIGKNDGMFDPTRRFAWTNISEDVFVSAWDGNAIVVQPGQTVELPHHLANKFTDELVDKIMIGEVAVEEKAEKDKTGNHYYRSPRASSLGVPAARKVWEDKMVRELSVDEESPEVQVMRAQIKEELMADMAEAQKPAGDVSSAVPASVEDFAGLKNDEAPKPRKRTIRVKVIK